jgi:YihY family inner membrane protein
MRIVDRTLDRIDRWQQRRRIPAFVVGVIKKYGDDRGGHLAALITYYGFLSLFPLLLVLVTVLGFLLHDNPSLRHDLLDSALADFPIVGQQLRRNVHAMGGSGLGLVIGLIGLVWGSFGVAQAAQHAMATVWNVELAHRPSFFARLARSVLILLVLALAVGAATGLAALATLVPSSVLLAVGSTVLLVALNVGLYGLAFRVLTPAEVPTSALWFGAVVGGTAWTALQAVGGWLVARQLSRSSELYGTFGVVLGLLFFLYLAAQIVVYAAEVNVVRTRRLYPRSLHPPPATRADDMVADAITRAEAHPRASSRS